jgi:hypothetical protein
MTDQTPKDQVLPPEPPRLPARESNGLKIFGIVFAASLVAALVAIGVVYFYLFQSSFTPVTLSAREEQKLEAKLDRLEAPDRSLVLHKGRLAENSGESLQPEPYTESESAREIIFTERELNALLARNTDLAHRLAIDLAEDLASAKLLVPLDNELPILGGKTLKVTAGLEMSYRNRRPIVRLRGISLWGVPIPNAWLGNIKNVDLVQEFGHEEGFWKSFADGIEDIEIREGRVRVRLKE